MADYKKIYANSNLIQKETPRAFLIKIPKEKLKFWYPKKLVWFKGKNDYQMTISVPVDMTIKIFKTGEGKTTSFTTIWENEINRDELFEYFGQEIE